MISLYFSPDEKSFFETVLRDGLHQPSGHYWWVVRFAIAQSLKIGGEPDERYGPPSTKKGDRGSELSIEQITGLGKEESQNYDDALRILLGVIHDEELFDNNRRYVELVQRHARRGLEFMRGAWTPARSFYDYLLDELYVNAERAEHAPDVADGLSVLDFATLTQGLKQLGIAATAAADVQEGPRLSRFQLTLAGVEDYERLKRGLDDLAFAMGLGNTGIGLSKDFGERRVILDVPRPGALWHEVAWQSIGKALVNRAEAMPVSPGVDVLGQPIIFDLAEAPHLFVAGATGSGKSVCLNALLLSLVISARPPELLMIDPKGVDFSDFNSYSRLRTGSVITDMGQGIEALRGVVVEMEERQELLRRNNVRNITEAQALGVPMERLVVVIDELADFMLGRTGAEEPLVRLAQKARATGIHLVLATQRPEAATFSGLLRANVPARIALTVQKATDSRIILDEGGAEKLLMRGDMLIKLSGRATMRAHGVKVSPSEVKAALSTRSK
ncbi:cell division protein FtsK [Pseudomonas prosekii]|uniref:Cell division protein FtsK n=1 Tax=Pseudomonas prosekii TaxID=1148509 RepID=A0A3L8CUR4_9PSED|nr:FtsK/SpoIIIE domain-containing protein [Pseudomonas prosekii]RLU09073.1 cell division protein FtsK [Pseudomonas prosekii]RLU12012.1 cell division protein FtsK [Pseudomonas prosekii]